MYSKGEDGFTELYTFKTILFLVKSVFEILYHYRHIKHLFMKDKQKRKFRELGGVMKNNM